MTIEEKENLLHNILTSYKSAAIGFSGGTDSTLLLYKLSVLKIKTIAYTFHSYLYPQIELDESIETAKKFNIKHIVIENDPLNDIKNIETNPADRCYICKKHLFGKILEEAKKENLEVVLDGSNIDDLKDYRPGRKAVEELNVISPLELAKFTKEDVRYLLKKYGLKQFNKPSFACYFSRFPYNQIISKKDFEKVSKCETFIHSLGLKSVRLRHHNNIARLEASNEDMIKCINNINIRTQIDDYLKSMGYDFTAVDIKEYKTGSMNKTIKNNE